MNSQILTKINDFVKNRLIELLGGLLMLISIFLLVSIVSYSPSDPNFIYSPENRQINNIGGFYGSVISDLLLQSLGLISVYNFIMEQGHISLFNDLEIFRLLRKSKLFPEIAIVLLDSLF